MHETIRAALKRRVRWCMAVGAAGIIALVTLPAAASPEREGPNPLFLVLGFALFLGAAVGLRWLARCPKCKEKLGQELALRLGIAVFRQPPNFCPYCGVSFDEPRPGKVQDQPIQSQNPIK